MPTAKLTETRLKRLQPDPDKIVVWRDSEWPCLCLDVNPKGKMTWKVRGEFKGKTIRCKIGDWPELTREQAYFGWTDEQGHARPGALEASRYMHGAKGKHPSQILKGATKGAYTLQMALDGYLAVMTERSQATRDQAKDNVARYFNDWKDKPLNEITSEDIIKRHRKIPADIV